VRTKSKRILTEWGPRLVGYIDEQAAGAWPNGTRVMKTGSDETDKHGDGARATVVGSFATGEVIVAFCYFVEWDDMPGLPMGIRCDRLIRIDS
jgi:hypothetical protein